MNDTPNSPNNTDHDLNCWQILAIEPSPDEAIIKRAYAAQLKFNRPDRNPQGFQRLRAAYEEALSIRYWVGDDWEDEDDYEDSEIAEETLEEAFVEITEASEPAESKHSQLNFNENKNVSDNEQSAEIVPLYYKHAEPAVLSSDASSEMLMPNKLADDNKNLDDKFLKHQSLCENSLEEKSLDNQDLENPALEPQLNTLPLNNDPVEDFESDLPTWEEQWQLTTEHETPDKVDTRQGEPSKTVYDLQTDQRLFMLLTEQLETLSWSSLDDKADYEERLIGWWSSQNQILPKSYSLVQHYFDWQQRLNSWQYNHYPWYMLTEIQERHLQWQTIARQEQWQNATNPNTAAHHFNQQTIAPNLADQNLFKILNQQIQEIDSLPTELKTSYRQAFEMDLLKWWQKKSDRYPNSYEMAYQYFDWQQEPEAQNQVKAHLLKSLKRRYQHIIQLQKPSGFQNLLASDYYHIHRLWMPNIQGENQLVNRWEFFKTYFIPANALLLANDFERLDSHWQGFLDNQQLPSNMLSKIEAYRNNPDLTTLQRWLYQGFFDSKTLLAINLIAVLAVGAITFIRGDGHTVTDYAFDMLGVMVVVTAGLYYWQLLLRCFALPRRFRIHYQNILMPLAILSVLFIISYLAWNSVLATQMMNNLQPSKTLTPPPVDISYYAAHVVGLLIVLLFINEQSNIGLKLYGWLWGIILMMCILVFPLLGLLFASSSGHIMNYISFSPLWWLALSVPFALTLLMEKFEAMAFANRLVDWFVFYSVYVSLFLLFIIFTYAVTDLPHYKLGLTGISIIIMVIFILYISFHSLKRLGEIGEINNT